MLLWLCLSNQDTPWQIYSLIWLQTAISNLACLCSNLHFLYDRNCNIAPVLQNILFFMNFQLWLPNTIILPNLHKNKMHVNMLNKNEQIISQFKMFKSPIQVKNKM
jgi:hypothetical protein